MDTQTLNDKCRELAQRLGWPVDAVTWERAREKGGSPARGVLIKLRRKLAVHDLIEHFQVTFPASGQALFRTASRGCWFHILDMQVEAEAEVKT